MPHVVVPVEIAAITRSYEPQPLQSQGFLLLKNPFTPKHFQHRLTMFNIIKITLTGIRKAVESAQGFGVETDSLRARPKAR